MNNYAAGGIETCSKTRNLSNDSHIRVYHDLLACSKAWRTSLRCCSELRGKIQLQSEASKDNLGSAQTKLTVRVMSWTRWNRKRRGRRDCKTTSFDPKALNNVPVHQGGSLHSFSLALNVPLTTLQRPLEEDVFRRHFSAHKPRLPEQNENERLKYCLRKNSARVPEYVCAWYSVLV